MLIKSRVSQWISWISISVSTWHALGNLVDLESRVVSRPFTWKTRVSKQQCTRFLSNIVSPGFVTEQQPFTNGECSPLSDIGEDEGKESRVVIRQKKSFVLEGSFTRTRQMFNGRWKRDWDNWHVSDRERIQYRTGQSHRHNTITPKFRNANTANTRCFVIAAQVCKIH